MTVLVSVNASLLITLIVITIFSIVSFGKSMFGDMSKIIFINVIIAPPIIGLSNLIILHLLFPAYFALGAIPLTIPIIYIGYRYLDAYRSANKIKKFKKLKLLIISKAADQNIQILEEQIRIRLRPKNIIDIIVNVYNPKQKKIIENIFSEIKDFQNNELELRKFSLQFFIDEKKNINKIA